MNDNLKNLFSDADLIHAYSRKEALEDGVLRDVSDRAREAGFRVPVAVTAALWEDITNIPSGRSFQDVEGRLWDVLWMGLRAIQNSKERGSTLRYSLVMPVGARTAYTVKLVCGPGDNAEPVITLMRPEED